MTIALFIHNNDILDFLNYAKLLIDKIFLSHGEVPGVFNFLRFIR